MVMYNMRFKLEELCNNHPLVEDFAWGVGYGLLWDAIYEANSMTVQNIVSDAAVGSAFWIVFGLINKKEPATIAKKTGAFCVGSLVGQSLYYAGRYLF